MEAYIFINCDPRALWEVTKEARNLKRVKMAHAVTGQFDVVAYAEFVNMAELREIIDNLQAIHGVQRTRTAVAIPHRLE